MGVLAEYYLSTDEEAVSYDAEPDVPESERAQYKGIITLELSRLWSVLLGREWEER